MRRLRWFGVVEGRLLWRGTEGAGGTRKVPRSCHKRSTTTTAISILGRMNDLPSSNLLILAIGRF